ncbi:MAG: hypothetical protein RL095_2260 [Verrucomicrobiota bacterium]|jgi:ADP-ribosylglycohydrolase
MPTRSPLTALFLGQALGDSLGLPAEGLSRERIARLGWAGHWRQRLFFGKGFVSDDTEHLVLVAQALLESSDADSFQRRLAAGLRCWFLRLPAGIGFATLKACLKLCLGVPAARAGVRSQGNGPAMRATLLGAVFADDAAKRRDYTLASTRLTHLDPAADTGALAIAEAAAALVKGDSEEALLLRLAQLGPDDRIWQERLALIKQGRTEGWDLQGYCRAISCENGVSGWIHATVPVALYGLLSARDFKSGLSAVLDCGGDTDTVGAIAGALLALRFGEASLPAEDLKALIEFPAGEAHLRALAAALAGEGPAPRLGLKALLYLPRQLLFTAIVLTHGLMRPILALTAKARTQP